jgi:hypothetical protein
MGHLSDMQAVDRIAELNSNAKELAGASLALKVDLALLELVLFSIGA